MAEPWTREQAEDVLFGRLGNDAPLFVVVPCDCGEDCCHGWRLADPDEESE